MDILKVLSRGTKKPSKASQPSSNAAVSLPSAGTKTNPQLFHDDVRGQKRKRAGHEEPETRAEAELPNVDFFAPKPEPSATKPNIEAKETQRESSPTALLAQQRLSEDECRQLLKSHRLKFTLISKPEDNSRFKKAKKQNKVAVETKKDKQLYPQPLRTFGELRSVYGISRTVAENLVLQSYREPTEVQLGSLPILLRPDLATGDRSLKDANFLAVAPTGSGKTISFLIPAINSIMRRREKEILQGVHELEAVVVAPTRELVYQIVNEGNKLVQGTGIKIVGMKKRMTLATEQQVDGDDSDEDDNGSEHESQSEDEARESKSRTAAKVDILVTTPLLLLNFLASGSAKMPKMLPSVKELILDEADAILDLFPETLSLLRSCSNPDLRLSFWSATMGSNIESLVTEKLKSHADALGITPKPLVRLVVGLKDTALPNIDHRLVYTGTEQGKLLALRQLLRPAWTHGTGPPLRPPFLVFSQTIERATALHEELKYDIPIEAGGPSRIASLHGGLDDSTRAAIMRKFRAGEIWVLISTDLLTRGIDFKGVNGVVNYDIPSSASSYVHRVGRTGRAGREGGIAVTFYTKEDIPYVRTVANVIAASERQAGKSEDDVSVQKWLLDALPNVAKADRKKLKERGVEARRSGSKAKITSTSGFDRRKEHNRQGAVEASKRRKMQDGDEAGEDEWSGFED